MYTFACDQRSIIVAKVTDNTKDRKCAVCRSTKEWTECDVNKYGNKWANHKIKTRYETFIFF